jgi:hypothetical protein
MMDLYEVKAPVGSKGYIQLKLDPSITVTSVDWYVNGSWNSRDDGSRYLGGKNADGTPKGFTFSGSNAVVRAVVYYNTSGNYYENRTTYQVGSTSASYPKYLPAPVSLYEVKPASGTTVYLQVRIDSNVSATGQVDWYINNAWKSRDDGSRYLGGKNADGTPKGYTLTTRPSIIQPIVVTTTDPSGNISTRNNY